MNDIKEAWKFARNHPIEFAIEAVIAFAIVFGGAFVVALAG